MFVEIPPHYFEDRSKFLDDLPSDDGFLFTKTFSDWYLNHVVVAPDGGVRRLALQHRDGRLYIDVPDAVTKLSFLAL